jgi:hypothetical protein
MPVFSRKRLPANLAEAFEHFSRALEFVESAKAAAVGAVPMARDSGNPLAEALFEFDEQLDRADAAMASWRRPDLEESWDECRQGISEAQSRSAALKENAPELGFEDLLGAIAELILPLEPFEAAEERFLELKVRVR